MAYFECIIGGAGDGDILTVTCDERFAGLPITCTKGIESYTQTCPLTSPYEVVFEDTVGGTWTISGTIGSKTYSTTVEIIDTFTAELDAGFSWEEWLTLGGLDPTDYNSLDEVLADEKALRRLMTVHASVDYMCENSDDAETLEIILENDLAAKWINLRDYALDTLYAVPAIATIMDNAGKYGYGEWALMPQVPKMASNTAPYYSLTGVEDSSGQHYMWHAFDRNDSTFWNNGSSANDGYLIVDFGKNIEIKQVSIKPRFLNGHSFVKNFTISASDDGTTWGEPLLSGTHTDSADTEYFTIPNSSKHRYWRIRKDGNNYSDATIQILELQFYAWAPKGCIPTMTANDAPYGWASASSTYTTYEAWKAFDKDVNTLWGASTSTFPISLQYRFVNPVCAKRAYIYINDNNGASRVSTWKIQGSNTGGTNDWTDLTDTLNHSYVAGGEYVEIKKNDVYNSNYYAYYRAYFITGSAAPYVRELEIYGRTLNVSVPTMSNDTTPYGLAFATSETTTATAKAFAAFDGSTSTGAGKLSTSTSSERIGYRFLKPEDIRSVKLVIGGSSTTAFSRVIKFQYSDDNDTWTDIGGERTVNIPQGANTSTFSFDLGDENGAHQYWAMYVVKSIQGGAVSSWGTYCSELQFYGVDYSEREFAQGANMKYLYDHGIEFEPMSGDGYTQRNITVNDPVTKEPYQLYLYSPNTSGHLCNHGTDNIQNLTPYSLLRMAIGDKGVKGGSTSTFGSMFITPQKYINDATATATVANIQNSLDISSIDSGNVVVSSGMVDGRSMTVSELWLE